MMVSRPYEANLGRKKAKYNFSKFAKIFWVEKFDKKCPFKKWVFT